MTPQTTVSISQELVQQAMDSAGESNPQIVVQRALALLIETQAQTTHAQAGMRRLFGKIAWEGDLDEMRASRSFTEPNP